MKGYRKELKFVNQARDKGLVALRSAGSHSPIDCVVIDKDNRVIQLVQSKPDSWTDAQKNKLYESLKELEGTYLVYVQIL